MVDMERKVLQSASFTVLVQAGQTAKLSDTRQMRPGRFIELHNYLSNDLPPLGR